MQEQANGFLLCCSGLKLKLLGLYLLDASENLKALIIKYL
jgi:hypothetical protein